MRRPHVYERSVPRTRRDAYQEPAGDPAIVAQAITRTLPAMILDAENAGLTSVADHLTRGCGGRVSQRRATRMLRTARFIAHPARMVCSPTRPATEPASDW